ncbi:unnamed protein product [Paramecium pentaurelia]|uniref:Serine/threonine-protein phosphatase n=1 Tax=Paramecium pentaurelia TaxID=43138 RepID=A0A8S1UCN7_9CILI|nr:unnamed protein product [Paramecium pentaurelia]
MKIPLSLSAQNQRRFFQKNQMQKRSLLLSQQLEIQLYDIQELFKVGGKPPFTNYLFLGDYVDKGPHSVEVITLLSLLKVKFPNRVTLIRGNHEIRWITQNYGFYMECLQKYGSTQGWEYFTDMFDYIPIACIVGTNLLCVHGGLSLCIESVDEIEHLKRFQEIPHEGKFINIIQSDPDDEDTPDFKISPRGAGFIFGGKVLKEFLHFKQYASFNQNSLFMQ